MNKKIKLGELVEYYDETNQNGEFGDLEDLQGINSNKYFQRCKSNKNDIDLNRYRICRNKTFAYNKATSRNGEKISIAYRTEGDCLISPSYNTFKIKNKEIVLPEFLLLQFSKPSFDRYARFNSWGSATEFLNWEDFCDMEINLPDIETQIDIVNKSKIIENRTKILEEINDSFLNLIKLIFKELFIDNIKEDWNEQKLETIANIRRGASPRPIEDYISSEGINWLKISDVSSIASPFIYDIKEKIIEEGKNKSLFIKSGTLVVSNSATPGIPKFIMVDTCVHDGWLVLNDYDIKYKNYLYFLIDYIREILIRSANGSVFNNLKTEILKEYNIFNPDDNTLKKFNKISDNIMEKIEINTLEIKRLNELKRVLLAKV